MGSAALTALASAELLRAKDDKAVRRLLLGLNAFIRSMQRPDGELMHLYDVPAQRPIDVQRMYYSGEAADALLSSHRVLDSPADLGAAQRVMRHLTGAGVELLRQPLLLRRGTLDVPGRGAGGGRHRRQRRASTSACAGSASSAPCNTKLGTRRGRSRARSASVPVLVPRLTTVASRVEAAAMLYPVLRARGLPVAAVRAQIERSLGLLLRMRWAPGPAHLAVRPAAAFGGLPASL